MGHIRLGRLPDSRRWRAVLDLLDNHADADVILTASARAAEKDLHQPGRA